ncbi:MAG: hypothetical protein LGB07_04350 [Sulfurovum sp.]|nr:hypothetical protein [Sulfurovum sp.]MCB4744865.1 hypothetical protein [Sulfurovum sp.]MCB4747721.1 hypothetical protein [Sulfurovum sp.]MCB4748749.1 hypothetical protein [Sulfurovum sp.]MCB4750834.1 hypothetical protein [Sulfurovum sp.]
MKIIILITIVAIFGNILYANKKKVLLIDNADIVKSRGIKISTIRNGIIAEKMVYPAKKVDLLQHTQSTSIEKPTEYLFSDGTKFNSKSHIMIKFNKGKEANIKELEQNYHLKLIRKMTSGDFLFKIIRGDTLQAINAILKEESDKIERISPNISFNMKPL